VSSHPPGYLKTIVGTTMQMPRTAITEGERVRDDYGEIDRLASSLRKWGMLFPILVDQEFVLCDGGRRLRAAALAGLEFVPVTVREMTPEERAELELEVDREHKPFTELERNKHRVQQALDAIVAMQAKQGMEIGLSDSPISIRGPKPKGGIKQKDVADAAGVPLSTLKKAKAHVAAVEEFPELATIPAAKEAIKEAQKRRLEADPEAAEKKRQRLLEEDVKVVLSRRRRQYSKNIIGFQLLIQLDPAGLVEALPDEYWLTLDGLESQALKWFEECRRARSQGIHLVS
jgi:ParB-like nuclease domain